MVLIELKKSEKDIFLIEVKSNTQIKELTRIAVKLNNLRVRIYSVIKAYEGVIQNGPLRPEALRGLTQPETYNPAFENLTKEEKEFVNMSPLPYQEPRTDDCGYRTGLGLNKDYSERANEAILKVKQSISEELVKNRIPLTESLLSEALMILKGSVMIAFPGYHGIPNWEPLFLMLEEKFDFLNQMNDSGWLEEDNTVLWWAKKELEMDKDLSDYCGKNEKTKIVIKPMGKGKGMPLSESPIDQETQRKMMSYYHRKQEENKKLEAETEDNYLNSAWADPKALKNSLINGGRNIKLGSFK